MLEEKKLKESEKRVRQYLSDGVVSTKRIPQYVDFFLKNAGNTLDSAKLLFDVSGDKEKQKFLGFTEFNGLLWTVNASYYSMFYMVRALIEKYGIRITGDLSIHSITFDAFVHFFYLSGKLQKELVDDFVDVKGDSDDLLGKSKADVIVEDYFLEKRKRGMFTYEMGELLIQSKARTSLERAQRFRREILKIIEKKVV